MKKCLLVSYGPIPTTEYQQVEGGGMRIYGLAAGLLRNGVDVTVAIHEQFPQTLTEFEGIKLTNWRHDNEFISLINSFDSVIVSYSLGDSSTFIQENIIDDVQLVIDAYVPSYIEVSARESHDIENEYVNYFNDLPRYNNTLSRGDYFLVANPAQELLYTGVLSALGVINPSSYKDKRILDAPFGIHDTPLNVTENPYTELGIQKSDFTVLWFGGMYPWFRIEEYLEAIKQLSKNKQIKFVFVGGKNPRNGHPDFEIQYNTAVSFVKDNKLANSVSFVDWVDFDKRANWYKNADIVISLNQPAEENKYSWRTRVMDFVWGEAVILTNGGDPLSEDLIRDDAAVRLASLASEDIITAIHELQSNKKRITQIHDNVRKIKPRYYWVNLTKELSEIINAHYLPFQGENSLRNKTRAVQRGQVLDVSPSKVRKVVRLAKRTASYAKSKGVRRTGVAIYKSTQQRLKVGSLKADRKPQFVFISHPIDNTGAPMVLINIIEEYVEKYGSNRVRVIAPGVTPNHQKHLRKLGISVEKAVLGVGFRPIRAQLGLRPDDFVLMNTTAIYDNYLKFVLLWLKSGRLKNAIWFIHEDYEQCKDFIKIHAPQVKPLLKSNRLTIFFPSDKTRQAFTPTLGTHGLKPTVMKSVVDQKLKTPRTLQDFNELNFLISGTSVDGRKGQQITIAAFQHYLDTYYRDNPSNYRNFSLTLIAVSKEDYVSQQVRIIGKSSLGKHITIHDSMERSKALKIAHSCNAVICSSLHETYALYVAEGMLMGHIVLRSDVGGIDEQLQEGVNGYFIDTNSIAQYASVIEKLLNKKTTSNKALLAMSNASLKIAEDFENSSYLEQFEESN